MPLLTRKKLLLAKIEDEYGSDSTPTGAANAILVRNLEVVPLQSDIVQRELIRPYLGNYEQLLANTRVQVTFEVELAGSGTAGTPPAYGPILRSCALSEIVSASTSVTYQPESELSGFESTTLYFFIDGIRHIITGARGTFTLNGTVGAIPTIQFTMTGIFNTPTDEALAVPTYANQATPLIFKNGNTTSFSAFSYSGALQSIDFNIANEIIYRELIGGTKEVIITDRKPGGTLQIEAVLLATKNYFTVSTGSTTGSITFQHGTAAGNRATLTMAQSDLADVSYADMNGITMLNLPYVATPTAAGNDELSLVFT
jgi:hypothetical protein